MYYIYRITNKLNNKTYIGQHKYKDLSTDNYMGSGKYLWNAYAKYGIENFEKEILISEIETKEEINKLEREYIKLEREAGHGEYNISDGGEKGWPVLSGKNHPWYGKHLTKEIKDKISKSHKRENLSEETLSRMSEVNKGENNPNYGKSKSEEIRSKISKALKGRFKSKSTKDKIRNSKIGTHLSKEVRDKLSNNRIGKRYYNNGIECHLYYPGTEPAGYKLGKLVKNQGLEPYS